jgi:hypothetical protein
MILMNTHRRQLQTRQTEFYLARCGAITLLLLLQTSCVATVVNTAVDTTIAVAKVPFKVAGAAVDVAIPDNDKDKNKDDDEEEH